MDKKVVLSETRALLRSRMSIEQQVAALWQHVDPLVYEPDPEPAPAVPETPAPEPAKPLFGEAQGEPASEPKA